MRHPRRCRGRGSPGDTAGGTNRQVYRTIKMNMIKVAHHYLLVTNFLQILCQSLQKCFNFFEKNLAYKGLRQISPTKMKAFLPITKFAEAVGDLLSSLRYPKWYCVRGRYRTKKTILKFITIPFSFSFQDFTNATIFHQIKK